MYGARHLIENFFGKIKQIRAIATRYDKTARNFLAAVQLVASVIWLNGRHALVYGLDLNFYHSREGTVPTRSARCIRRCSRNVLRGEDWTPTIRNISLQR